MQAIQPVLSPDSSDAGGSRSLIVNPVPKQGTGLNTGNLCSRCASIDWYRLFTLAGRDPYRRERDPILQIKTLTTKWATPRCDVCMLLESICPTGSQNLDLTLSSWEDTPLEKTRPRPWPKALAINRFSELVQHLESGAIYKCPSSIPLCSMACVGVASLPGLENECNMLRVRWLDAHAVDYIHIQSWLSTCRLEHGNECNSTNLEPVKSLRVINVRTRQLEWAAEDCRYCALSYVWGPPEVTGPSSAGLAEKGLLSSAPATIEDSMTVTKRLGFQYLWVDRYCIPQTDHQDRHEQLGRMDYVFRNAELTIIAGAGKDPTFGLPGVGLRPRIPQPRARVAGFILASTTGPPTNFSWNSPWASRAWTYQEGICSRRRLIFTEEQLLFQCRTVHCRETLNLVMPISEYNVFSMGLDDRFPWSIWTHIENYSGRSLTYESDGLNGFLGILRMFRAHPYPVYHFWGMPILPLKCRNEYGNMQKTYRSLEESFLAGFRWTSKEPGTKRRKGFPSWSWAGWTPPTSASINDHVWGPDIYGHVLFCHNDGSVLDFHTALNAYIMQDESLQLAPNLIIEAWTVDIRGKSFPNCDPEEEGFESDVWCWMADHGSDGEMDDTRIAAPLEFNCTREKGLEMLEHSSHELFGIVLTDMRRRPNNPFETIILAKSDGDTCERVGQIMFFDSVRRISLSTGQIVGRSRSLLDTTLTNQDWITGDKIWRRFKFV